MAAATAARGAHRPAGRGLLCSHAARGLRAPPAGSARLQGSPIPRRQRERPRARIDSGRTRSAAPGGGGDVVLSRRVLRDKTGSRSRGGSIGAPGGGRQEAGREGARSPRGARLRAGRGANPAPKTGPGGPARRPRRAHRPPPPGTARLLKPPAAGPAARSRRRLAPWDRAGCGWGRAAGLGSAVAGPHSLTMPGCDCRGGGGQAGAQRPKRASREPRARRLHWCRSVCERSKGDTRTHTPAHKGAPRGEGRAAAHRHPRLHAPEPGEKEGSSLLLPPRGT